MGSIQWWRTPGRKTVPYDSSADDCRVRGGRACQHASPTTLGQAVSGEGWATALLAGSMAVRLKVSALSRVIPMLVGDSEVQRFERSAAIERLERLKRLELLERVLVPEWLKRLEPLERLEGLIRSMGVDTCKPRV